MTIDKDTRFLMSAFFSVVLTISAINIYQQYQEKKIIKKRSSGNIKS